MHIVREIEIIHFQKIVQSSYHTSHPSLPIHTHTHTPQPHIQLYYFCSSCTVLASCWLRSDAQKKLRLRKSNSIELVITIWFVCCNKYSTTTKLNFKHPWLVAKFFSTRIERARFICTPYTPVCFDSASTKSIKYC